MARLLLMVIFATLCLPALSQKTFCGSNLDVYLAIDGSHSIDKTSFKELYIPAIAGFVQNFLTSSNNNRIGFVLFSSGVETVPLTSNFTMLDSALRNVSHPNGGTKTHLALDEIAKRFKSTTSDATKVAVVITDGVFNNRTLTLQAGTKLKDAGVTIFVVGITQWINQEENEQLASSPSRAIHVDNIAGLSDRLRTLTDLCSETRCKYDLLIGIAIGIAVIAAIALIVGGILHSKHRQKIKKLERLLRERNTPRRRERRDEDHSYSSLYNASVFNCVNTDDHT